MADKSDNADSTSPVVKSSRCFVASPDDVEYVAAILAAQEKDDNASKPLVVNNLLTVSVFNNPLPTAALGQITAKRGRQVVHPCLRIRIYFFDSEKFKIRCDKVMAVVQDWAKYAHVSFVLAKKPEDTLIRVKFVNGGYSSSTFGLDHYIVTDPTVDTMTFGEITDRPETSNHEKYLILHEFGHVLGLYHEHQTPSGLGVWTPPKNRVEGFSYAWNPLDINYRPHQPQDVLSFTVIDLDSVMTYPLTKEMSDERLVMRENSKLSKWDKAFMVINYPRIGDPTEDADGTIWTIEVALDLLGVVDEDDLGGELEGFRPLGAKYEEVYGEKAQDVPLAEEGNPQANARLRILNLYDQLGEAVAALAGRGSISDKSQKTKEYIIKSTGITTRMRNVFGEWTQRKFLAAKDHRERRKPVNSNKLVSGPSAAYLEFLSLTRNDILQSS